MSTRAIDAVALCLVSGYDQGPAGQRPGHLPEPATGRHLLRAEFSEYLTITDNDESGGSA